MSPRAATVVSPRRWLAGVAVAGCLIAGSGVALTHGERVLAGLPSHANVLPPSSEPGSTPGDASRHRSSGVSGRDRRALRDVLRDQQEALARGDRAAYVATWLHDRSGSRQQAEATYANITALGLTDVQLRLLPGGVDAVAPTPSGSTQSRAWTASVRLLSSLDRGSSRQRYDLTYTFADDGAETRIQSIEVAAVGREPTWLQGRLTVIRTPRVMVVGHDKHTVASLSRQLTKARRDVRAVIGSWPRRLLLVAPRNLRQWERGLGIWPGQYDDVAAVTTTVDGAIGSEAPVMIVLNPGILPRLHDLGVSLVLAHEIVHAATGAVTVDTAAWIVEGFAEYVAFKAVPLPVRFSAGSALREVRHHGLPDQLPTDVDFATPQTQIVAYAQSWVLCRTIAHQYGERALVDFYEAMLRKPNRLGASLRSVLGTTEHRLTQRWSVELQRLSSLRSTSAER